MRGGRSLESQPRLVAGRYALREQLGEGSFAVTYRATDTVLERDVAIKVLREAYLDHPGLAARFEAEARAAARVNHPNVVPVYDFGREGVTAYIVMPFVAGPSLRQVIRERTSLPVDEAVALAGQLLNGLTAIHAAGIVHRDVTPQNALLEDGRLVRLTDFGIARLETGPSGLTATGTTLGTAAYMAPEQAAGEAIGPQSDLYAVGVILYELLTGRLPFPGDNPVQIMYRHVTEPPSPPRALNGAIPLALEAVVLRALAKAPEARYADARAMSSALLDPASALADAHPRRLASDPERATAQLPVVAGVPARDSPADPPREPPRSPGRVEPLWWRYPWRVVLPLMMLVGLGLAAGTIALADPRGRDETDREPRATMPAISASPTLESTATSRATFPPATMSATEAPPTVSTMATTRASITATITATPTPEPPTTIPQPPTATPQTPTATAPPLATTPVPPTATPAPPTATLEPPTATPPPPTATLMPPTATPAPSPTP